MDLTKMQYENITLAEIMPEDEDDIYILARLADDEGIQHGDWLARSVTVTDEELSQLQDGINPENGEPYGAEERQEALAKQVIDFMTRYQEKQRVKIWKIFNDDEYIGYMLFIGCYGAPYLHFLTTEEYSDAEDKADLISQCINASLPFLTFFFDHFSREIQILLYAFHEDVEDMEFSLGQVGFEQLDDMDYYDYKRLACFSLSRRVFQSFKESIEE